MIQQRPNRIKLLAPLIALTILAGVYQNCSGDVAFNSIVDLNSITGTTEEPQYAQLKVGDSTNFPPLKLFFIVDNSGTMQANQINLSTAFSQMFNSQNADNLAPFESTAYVFNTAQVSIQKNSTSFSKLPKNDLSYFEQFSVNQLNASIRSNILDGQVPGDLVGYRAVESNTNGLYALEFKPAPVANFAPNANRSIASAGIFKSRQGSVTALASEFSQRIGILDPARSAIDPVSRTGVLDSVIDKESGLCAVARILRNKNDFIKPGDMAAFVIVSDEEDTDSKGVSCIQSYKEYQSNDEFFDGSCTTPRTTLTYRDINPSPSDANCKVDYNTGFRYTYTYSAPRTDVTYAINARDYKVRQSTISYTSATHTFTQPRVVVSYFTKNPSYQLPQSTISYFRKVESCDIRDGVKFNCTYAYPKGTTPVYDESFTNCSTFATGKLPADAVLNNATYPVTCNALPLKTVNGACTANDPIKLNCQQNYSNSRTQLAAVNGSVTSTCVDFATGRLPANGVLSDAGYEVQCTNSPLTNVLSNGLCPTTNPKQDCVQNIVAQTSSAIDGLPTAATAAACMTFAKSKRSSLNSNAIFDNSAYAVTCTEAAGRLVTNEEGLCSTLGSAYKDCTERARATTSATYNGSVASGQTCKQFVQTAIGSSRVIADSPAATCTVSAATQTITSAEKTMSYSNAVVANYTPTVNGSCLAVLKDYIAANDAVPTPATCVVRSITNGSSLHNTKQLCGQIADPVSFCSSSSRRNCVATDVPAGGMYMANTTSATFAGDFTCNTLCSETGFCKSKVGTVEENYKDCSVKAAPTFRNFKEELYANRNNVCVSPELPAATITKGPYRLSGTKIDYVAGAASEQGLPNALANYIRDESLATFGANTPAVSVFVRQANDPLGTNGSRGLAYNAFADLMGGEKRSVLSNAAGYASSLESLSGVIKDKLARSFTLNVGPGQTIHRVWHRKAGTTDWGAPIDASNWSASGGTVTIDQSFTFAFGDEFRMEYY
jgi:hypothetical protein